MNTTQVSVDLAKNVFQVAVSHTPGRVHREHRLSRAGLRRFFAEHEPVQVRMEACGTAHHWGRQLQSLGHQVSLLSPFVVSRYRTGNKTDRPDTMALLEAARNKKIHPVPVKSVEQQAVTALHRLRSGHVATRTARINAVRGHLREFGVSIPLGARHVVPRARAALEEERSYPSSSAGRSWRRPRRSRSSRRRPSRSTGSSLTWPSTCRPPRT